MQYYLMFQIFNKNNEMFKIIVKWIFYITICLYIKYYIIDFMLKYIEYNIKTSHVKQLPMKTIIRKPMRIKKLYIVYILL